MFKLKLLKGPISKREVKYRAGGNCCNRVLFKYNSTSFEKIESVDLNIKNNLRIKQNGGYLVNKWVFKKF